MKIIFRYQLEKDIENFNAANNFFIKRPTKIQTRYNEIYNGQLTDKNIKEFIGSFVKENKINIKNQTVKFQKLWDEVNKSFFERASKIFDVSPPKIIIRAYLTTHDRCTYSIKDRYFFINLMSRNPRLTAMHELWHFYTWFAFNKNIKSNSISEKFYYDIKESLTEILNLEFSDLMDGEDKGYPQHRKLRESVKKYWLKYKDIHKVFEQIYKNYKSKY